MEAKGGNERLKIKDDVGLTLLDKHGNVKHAEKGFSCTIIKKEKEGKNDESTTKRRI